MKMPTAMGLYPERKAGTRIFQINTILQANARRDLAPTGPAKAIIIIIKAAAKITSKSSL